MSINKGNIKYHHHHQGNVYINLINFNGKSVKDWHGSMALEGFLCFLFLLPGALPKHTHTHTPPPITVYYRLSHMSEKKVDKVQYLDSRSHAFPKKLIWQIVKKKKKKMKQNRNQKENENRLYQEVYRQGVKYNVSWIFSIPVLYIIFFVVVYVAVVTKAFESLRSIPTSVELRGEKPPCPVCPAAVFQSTALLPPVIHPSLLQSSDVPDGHQCSVAMGNIAMFSWRPISSSTAANRFRLPSGKCWASQRSKITPVGLDLVAK